MEIRLLGETQEEIEETERDNNELVFAGEDGGNQDEFEERDYMNRDNEGEEVALLQLPFRTVFIARIFSSFWK